jgi:hypothetical protein
MAKTIQLLKRIRALFLLLGVWILCFFISKRIKSSLMLAQPDALSGIRGFVAAFCNNTHKTNWDCVLAQAFLPNLIKRSCFVSPFTGIGSVNVDSEAPEV